MIWQSYRQAEHSKAEGFRKGEALCLMNTEMPHLMGARITFIVTGMEFQLSVLLKKKKCSILSSIILVRNSQ